MPQARLLTDFDGSVGIDFIGRYEDLQQTYDEICSRIGISSTHLERRNPSEHKAYTEYYDDELRDMVAEFYDEDLRTFDYSFEPDSGRN